MIRVRLSLQYPALEVGVRAMLASDPLIVVEDAPGAQDGEADGAIDVEIMTPRVLENRLSADPGKGGSTGIVVLGADDAGSLSLWQRGIPWGVLPMEVTPEELTAAVRGVAAGLVIGTRHLLVRGGNSNLAPSPLTEREVEILAMLSGGLANKQIAIQLGISEHTVKFHVSSIYAKLNVANRTEAVREGLRNGWIAL